MKKTNVIHTLDGAIDSEYGAKRYLNAEGRLGYKVLICSFLSKVVRLKDIPGTILCACGFVPVKP